jgi:hypothetical protein
MKYLIAEHIKEFTGLTRPEKARAWWYCFIILTPLAAIILAHQLYGPSLGRVMGW